MKTLPHGRAFAQLELLVVIAIIAVLSGLLAIGLARAKASARSAKGPTTPLLSCSRLLEPAHAGMLPLQRGFEFRVGVRLERRPVQRRFEPFAVPRAESELDRQLACAD